VSEITDDERAFIFACCGYSAKTQLLSQYARLMDYRVKRLTQTEADVVRQYLATLRTMTGPLDNNAARLRDDWRRRLCGFLGVPPGPAVSIHQELAP